MMLVPYDIVVVSVILAFAGGIVFASAMFQLLEGPPAKRKDRAEPREWR